MSVNSKMTAIADAIRAKTGGTGLLTLDDMAQDIAAIDTSENLDEVLDEQDSIIDQIQAALEGKAAATNKGIVSQKFKDASLNIISDEATGAVNISDCEFLGASSIGFESKNTGSFIVANCAFWDTSLALFGDGNFTFIGCEFWNCTKEYISDGANAALISGGNTWDGEPYS